ncbi:MAG: branched-chain amino acid ABC transporter substrate-binding protein [Candidatus Berkiella sp.]
MHKLVRTLIAAALFNISAAFAQDQVIKIGIAGPFSGPYASFGDQFWLGAEKAVDDLNNMGGINGQKVELVKADDGCDPKQAVAVAKRLVDEKVTAVIGHFCSSSTLPASQIYADAGTLMMTPGSTSPTITERGLRTIFRLCGRDDQQSEVASKFMIKDLKVKNVAIIHDKDTYGKGLADDVKSELEERRVKIGLYEGVNRGSKNFAVLTDKIKKLDPDAIYFGGLHSDAGALVKQLRENNIEAPIIAGDGIVASDFVTSAGGHKQVKGIYMTFGIDPRTLKSAKETVKAFKAEQLDPEGYTLYSYAAVQAIAKAMQETKSIDGQLLADWLHKNKVNTVLGEKSWDNKGDLKTTEYMMYEWNGSGKYAPLR